MDKGTQEEMSQSEGSGWTEETVSALLERGKKVFQQLREQYQAVKRTSEQMLQMAQQLPEGHEKNFIRQLYAQAAFIALSLEIHTGMLEWVTSDGIRFYAAIDELQREYSEVTTTKKLVTRLNQRLQTQARRYGIVLDFLEKASKNIKEQEKKAQEGLSYVK